MRLFFATGPSIFSNSLASPTSVHFGRLGCGFNWIENVTKHWHADNGGNRSRADAQKRSKETRVGSPDQASFTASSAAIAYNVGFTFRVHRQLLDF